MEIDRQRVTTLLEDVKTLSGSLARNPTVKRVHRFRTSVRRTQALLEFLDLAGDGNGRKLVKELSKPRRRAGRVRDLDVQLAALRTVKIGREGEMKAALARALEQMREKRQKKLVKLLDGKTRSRIRKRAGRLESELESRLRAPLPEAKLLAALAGAVSEWNRIAGRGPLTATKLHEYRLRGKRLRYMAELIAENPHAREIAAQVERMQDAIGEWRDWVALTGAATKVLHRSPQPALVAALKNVAQAKFHEAVQVAEDARPKILGAYQELGRPQAAKKPVSRAATAARSKPAAAAG